MPFLYMYIKEVAKEVLFLVVGPLRRGEGVKAGLLRKKIFFRNI